MRLLSYLLAGVAVQHVAAARIAMHAREAGARLRRRGNIFGQSTLTDSSDFSYYTNITLNGDSFSVLIDTGSSDLWVAGSVSNANDTGYTSGVTYAVGSVSGPVMTADLEFAGYTVKSQAFLQVDPSSDNPSGTGLIGLGPNNGSNIFETTNGLSSADAPLDRIFRQNTSTPNFLTVLLGRKDDPSDPWPGDLTVGEYLAGYEDVQNQPHLEVTQVAIDESGNQHWQTLLDEDGIIGPNGKKITTTSTVNDTTTPKQLNVVFDTGFSIPQVPKAVADAIYGDVSGAKLQNVSGIGSIYVLPCKTELNLTFVFGGKNFSIHPLDVVLDALSDSDDCVGAFQPMSTDTGGLFDAIFGMAFLRNAYLLVNFGDFVDDANTTADPFVQLLSVTNDTAEMHKDFVKVRSSSSSSSSSSGKSWFDQHRKAIIIAIIVVAAVVAVFFLSRSRRSRGLKTGTGAGLRPGGATSYIPLSTPAPPAATDLHYSAPPAYQPYTPPSGPPPPAGASPYAPPSGPPPGAAGASPYAPPSGPPPSNAYAPPPGPPPPAPYADPFRDHH
ncbi:acid protease [Punctularia strigosozonata HHB-11173 SS5]|uniref:acid protease n=1 Tax=Punctularia strigosozonata (strain HHB-11173) TaxID=741275 RepID=UPI00044168A3|nr:acid protease [Punctularia strigosozonata HHB-11173 SS5]EIN07494.1 acid protease [Punctularia strigosozonata HHB-11173 SS5]